MQLTFDGFSHEWDDPGSEPLMHFSDLPFGLEPVGTHIGALVRWPFSFKADDNRVIIPLRDNAIAVFHRHLDRGRNSNVFHLRYRRLVCFWALSELRITTRGYACSELISSKRGSAAREFLMPLVAR